MNEFLIRPFSAADAEAVAALITQSYRGQWVYTAADLLLSAPQPLRARWVALRAGEVVATLSAAPVAESSGPFAGALRLSVAGDLALRGPARAARC